MPSVAQVFDLGDTVPLSTEILVGGVLTDAATVTVTVTSDIDGTSSTPTVTRISTGLYRAEYVPTTTGHFTETWQATNPSATYRDSFDVRSTPTGIVSLADVQAGLANTNTNDDETLRALILMASDICEQRTRLWRRQTITTTHDGGTPKLQLRSPIISVTTATENGTTVPGTGYTLDPVRGWLWRGGPTTPQDWAWGRQNITITYVAGAPNGIIPEPIRRGCTELVRYQFNQQRGGGLPRNAGYDGVIDPGSGWLIPRPVQQLWQPYAAVLVA